MTWQDALKQTLAAFRDQPLVWGQYDCCQFARVYVRNVTGIDYGADLQYDSREGADALLRDGVEALITRFLGPSKPDATPGDIVVCHVEALHTVGIAVEPYVWSFVHEHGLCRLHRKSIVCAWSI